MIKIEISIKMLIKKLEQLKKKSIIIKRIYILIMLVLELENNNIDEMNITRKEWAYLRFIGYFLQLVLSNNDPYNIIEILLIETIVMAFIEEHVVEKEEIMKEEETIEEKEKEKEDNPDVIRGEKERERQNN